MSVYDFNHNDHFQQSAHGNHNASNGTQANRYQAEGDYLSRSFATSNQPDMSVQMARPTSKTAMLVRQRRAMLEQLSCSICDGYLIDATTIDECMDSFCKSCLVKYLRTNNDCPRCGMIISKANPFNAIHSDKVLQDIVYKLVPGLYDDEMKRRRDYYRQANGGPSSSEDDEEDSSSSSSSGADPNHSNEKYGVVSHPKPFYKPTDNIDLSIEPQTRPESSSIYYDNKRQSIVTCFTGLAQNHQQQRQQQQTINSLFSIVESQQFKTYLRCPAKLTVSQLKKFIAAKFNICRDDMIRLLYLNESLKDEYSLIDIAYIYDWRGTEHMQLYYVIERDISKVMIQSESQTSSGQHSRINNTRQNAAISTQTVKRVYIDPQPRFYEEQRVNNDGANNNQGNNRLTRSKAEVSIGTNRGVVNQDTQIVRTPILRSYGSSQAGPSAKIARQSSNGSSVQDVVTSGDRRADSQPTYKPVSKPDPAKDARTTRKTVAESNVVPKINLSFSTTSRDSVEKNNNTYIKAAASNPSQQSVGSKPTVNSNQVASYSNRNIATTSAGVSHQPNLSSMVTLASFTAARSNHVTVSANPTAAPITGSYKNILNAGSMYKSQDSKTDNDRSKSAQKSGQNAPQLAFSFVTERGIVIRRLNNRADISATTTTTTTTSASPSTPCINTFNRATMGSVPALMAAASQAQQQYQSSAGAVRSNTSTSSQQSISNTSNQSSLHGAGNSGGASSSGGGPEAPSARHLIKAKPVYKTLVDPTKVKSPNFKKLGFTARH